VNVGSRFNRAGFAGTRMALAPAGEVDRGVEVTVTALTFHVVPVAKAGGGQS
jgi:hypothetical protein